MVRVGSGAFYSAITHGDGKDGEDEVDGDDGPGGDVVLSGVVHDTLSLTGFLGGAIVRAQCGVCCQFARRARIGG